MLQQRPPPLLHLGKGKGAIQPQMPVSLRTFLVLFSLFGIAQLKIEVGTSPGYQAAANQILSYADFFVNPCYDFFEFSCGKWKKQYELGEDDNMLTPYSVIEDRVSAQMRESLEYPKSTRSKGIRLLDTLFNACLNIVERTNDRELRFGFWPLIEGDKWNASNFDLTALLIETDRTRDINIRVTERDDSVFVNIRPEKHLLNASAWIIGVDSGSLSLGGTVYYSEDNLPLNRGTMQKRARFQAELYRRQARKKLNRPRVDEEIEEMIEFERQLSTIFSMPPETSSGSEKKMETVDPKTGKKREMTEEEVEIHEYELTFKPFSKLKEHMPVIDWDRYFEAVLPKGKLPVVQKKPHVLGISRPDILEALNYFLSESKPRVIMNYVIYRLLLRNFICEHYSDMKSSKRWKQCLTEVSEKMRYASSALFVREHFDKHHSKDYALDITKNIRETFEETIDASTWMDKSTKTKAKAKLHHMSQQVGFPSGLLNDSVLDAHYEGIDLDPKQTYLEMARKFAIWKNRRLFNEKLAPGYLSNSLLTYNAFYAFTLNEIFIPAAVLESPFFNASYPKVMNYGGIGTTIGHEITHGFDTRGKAFGLNKKASGAHFDSRGFYHNWWDDKSMNEFEKRALCIAWQFGNITEPNTGVAIDGVATSGENIADLGGVKAAMKAYQRFVKKHGEEKRLPGLEGYTIDQVFFIAYGQKRCENVKYDFLRQVQMSDAHPPGPYRVNTVLSNLPEFAKAFHCPIGSPMNPKKRCSLW